MPAGTGLAERRLAGALPMMGQGDSLMKSSKELRRGLAFMQKILNSSVLKRGGSSSLSLACAIKQSLCSAGAGICAPHPL